MTKIEKALRILCSYSIALSAVALVGWVFVFVAYIITRYFGIGWLFVEEYTGYWLVALAYIPSAYALRTKKHISTDIVTKRLPEKTRSVLKICTDSVGLVFVWYLLGRSIESVVYHVEHNTHADAYLYTLLWPTYLPISIGLALLAFAFVVQIAYSVMELMRASKGQESKRFEV